MAQKILNGVHISGTTQLDFMPDHESEGIITLGRYDSNTSRYHNIKSYVSSTEASNYLKFSLHNGTTNTVVDVLTLNGNKNATFTGKVTVGTGVINNSIGGDIAITQGAIGLRINDTASSITATTATLNNNNTVNLGTNNIRWKDLYLGGSITSGGGATFAGDVTIGDQSSSASTQAFGNFDQLKFDNSHSSTNVGPNKIVLHDNGSAWIGGFGIHSDTVSYYTGGEHVFYKTTSQTASTQLLSLGSTGATFAGDVLPSADNTHDLGSSTKRWQNVVAVNLHGDGSNLTGVTVSNADTVDNLHAASFLRSDADDTATGIINFTKKANDYDTIPPNQNLLDIGSIKIAGRDDIYGNATKTVITDYVAKYVNDNTGGTTIRMYVDDNILVDGDPYMVSVYYENLIGTLSVDFADIAVTGVSSQTGTSSAPKSGRIYGHATRADYTSTYRFVDINLNQGSGHEVTLHSPKVEAGTTLTDFVATERTDMPTNSMHVRELIATSDATFARRVSVGGASNPTGGAKLHVADGTGAGLEVIPQTTNNKVTLLSYDRSDTAYQSLNFEALDFSFLNGNATFAGNVTVGANTLQNGANPGLKIQSTNTYQTVLGLHNTTTRNWEVAVGGSANSIGAGLFYIYDNTANDARLVIDTSGSVGIGTNSPATDLHVNSENAEGSLTISRGGNNMVSGQGVGSIVFPADYSGTPTNYGKIVTYANALSAVRGSIDFKVKSTQGNLLTGLTVYGTSSGVNVGIGTNSPGSKLTVDTSIDGNSAPLLIQNSGLNNSGQLQLGIPKGNNAYATGSALGDVVIRNTEANSKLILGGASSVVIGVGGTDFDPRMTIDSSGKVGIGTTSLNFRLGLSNSTALTAVYQQFTNGTTGTTASDGTVMGIDSDGDFLINNQEAKEIKLYTSDSLRLTIDSSGNTTFAGSINVNTNGLIKYEQNTDVDSSAAEAVASVVHGTHTAAFFDYVIKKGDNVRAGIVTACHDGTNVEYAETSTVDLGDTSDVTLSVDISGIYMRLIATTTSNDWSVKSLIRAI